jgi:hypothetical protein
MPLARQLHLLDLTGSRLDADVLAAFGQTDAASGLETLVLADTRMDDEMARCLSRVATFRDSKRLSVADNPDLGIEEIACLLEAEFALRLEAPDPVTARAVPRACGARPTPDAADPWVGVPPVHLPWHHEVA